MNPFELALYVIIIGGILWEVFIETLNLSRAQKELPSEFKDWYDADKYAKSQEYLRVTTRFGFLKSLAGGVVLLAFLRFGGFNHVDQLARSLAWSELTTGLAFMGILGGFMWLFSLPFSLYSTFVIEEKFGFNRTTLQTFALDRVKGLFLSILLGTPVLAAILWFFERTGDMAWAWSWGGVTFFQFLMFFLAPVLILPLFNKYEPLEDGELKKAIEDYAASQKFQLAGLFKMDGSKRSSKSNAFFTGFGKYKRIVLFDTLIENQTTEELVAVLAHEIGHYKCRHIAKQFVVSVITSGLMFYLLALMMKNELVFDAFRMQHLSIYASITFFGILYAPISGALGLVSLIMSRKFEFEADAYSAQTYPHKGALENALKKLSVDNLSNLTPHPLKVFFEYTHPPVLQRIEKIKGA